MPYLSASVWDILLRRLGRNQETLECFSALCRPDGPQFPSSLSTGIYIYNILHLQVYVHLQVHVYLNLIWLKSTVLKHTLPLLNIRIHSYKGHTTTERPLDKSIHWLLESITFILKWTSQSFICMYHVQF